jgi:hypothetical protein
MTETKLSSDRSNLKRGTRRNIPEDGILQDDGWCIHLVAIYERSARIYIYIYIYMGVRGDRSVKLAIYPQ